MAAPRLRADIASLPAYKAGQRPAERTDIVTYKISSNENPYPPLPSVVAAIAEAAATIHRYPDPFNRRLIAALADRFDVPEDHIALGTGSVSLVGQVIMSAAAAGDVASLLVRPDAAKAVTAMAQALGMAVIVEGEARAAARNGADGVQVDANTADVTAARQALGKDGIVGVNKYKLTKEDPV